jgi:TonB-dependent starch-binding outer membrane protein SusC
LLPGVNIVVEGTTTGTTTDVNGEYSLSIPDANSNLIFSYVGYVSEKIAVGGRVIVDLKLVPDVKKLDEVVVVGYGSGSKKDSQRKGTQTNAQDG